MCIRDRVAHAVLCHHGAGHFSCAFNIVGSARGNIVQCQRFCHTPAEQDHQLLLHFLTGVVGTVLRRQLHGVTASHPTRDDGNLMDGILCGTVIGGDRMPPLVVGRQSFLLIGHHVALFLRAHHHLDGGLLNFRHGNGLQAPSRGQQRRLIEQVLQIGAGKTGGRCV